MVIDDSLGFYRQWFGKLLETVIGDGGVRLDGNEARWTEA